MEERFGRKLWTTAVLLTWEAGFTMHGLQALAVARTKGVWEPYPLWGSPPALVAVIQCLGIVVAIPFVLIWFWRRRP